MNDHRPTPHTTSTTTINPVTVSYVPNALASQSGPQTHSPITPTSNQFAGPPQTTDSLLMSHSPLIPRPPSNTGPPMLTSGLHYDYSRGRLSGLNINPSSQSNQAHQPLQQRSHTVPSVLAQPHHQQAHAQQQHPPQRPAAVPLQAQPQMQRQSQLQTQTHQQHQPQHHSQPYDSHASGAPTNNQISSSSSAAPNNPPSGIQAQVASISALAIAPARPYFESAWNAAKQGMEAELMKMHGAYTQSLAAETDKLGQEIARLRSERNAFRTHAEKLQQHDGALWKKNGELVQENVRLVEENAAIKGERDKLMRELVAARGGELRMERERREGESDRRTEDGGRGMPVMSAPQEMWHAVREALRHDVEERVASILAEVQEERASRLEAERKLAQTQEQLKAKMTKDAFTLSSILQLRHIPSPSVPLSPATSALPDRRSSTAGRSATPSSDVKREPTHSSMFPRSQEIIDLTLLSTPQHDAQGLPSTSSSSMNELEEMNLIHPESAVHSRDEVEAEPGECGDDGRPHKRRRTSDEDTGSNRADLEIAREEGQSGVKVEVKEEEPEMKDEPEIDQLADSGDDPGTAVTQAQVPDPPAPERSSPSQTSHKATCRRQISISHLDILYRATKEHMICRICLRQRAQPNGAPCPITRFPIAASWSDLIGHAETSHGSWCELLLSRSPAEIAEMRHRLQSDASINTKVGRLR